MCERTVEAGKPNTVAITEGLYPSSRILFISDLSCNVILSILSVRVNTLFE